MGKVCLNQITKISEYQIESCELTPKVLGSDGRFLRDGLRIREDLEQAEVQYGRTGELGPVIH